MDRIKHLLLLAVGIALACVEMPDLRLCAEPLQSADNPALGSVEDAALHDIVFVDRDFGWAVGQHGAILHTTDGGAHWHRQHSGTNADLEGVSFVDRQNGWAVGGTTRPYLHTSQATLLRTTDGGQTWSAQLALIPAMTGVKFFNAKQGVAWGRGSGGDPLGVFASDDGGRNWRSLAVGPTSSWWCADFPDQRSGVVAGPDGQFARLAHGDALPIVRASAPDIHAVRFTAADLCWAVGAHGLIIHSDDGGKTWQNHNVLPADLCDALTWNTIATQGAHVWIAGSPGTVILHSPDRGKTWQGHATGNRTPIHKLTFVDDSHGWAVGALGTILHTNDGGQTWTTQQRGGERAAVLVLASDARHLPLATLAKLSGDGYRTVVHVFHGNEYAAKNPAPDPSPAATPSDPLRAGEGQDPTHFARLNEALTFLGCNNVTQSSLADANHEKMLFEVVRQIRLWRPAVVIGPNQNPAPRHSGEGLFDQQLAATIAEAVNQAADDDRFPLLTQQVVLPAWQVSRTFAVAESNTRGTHRVEYTAAVPGTGQTLAEVATAAHSLLSDAYRMMPETDEFQLQASLAGEPTASLDDLVAGLSIVHGSDCRRALPTALPFDAQVSRRLAEKRRNLANIFRFAEGNPALLSQVGQMTSDLDEGAAAALLFELSAQFRETHQTQLAADTLNLLARRFPNASVTDAALTWLVQFYASSETAHAYRESGGLSLRLSQQDQGDTALRGNKSPGSQVTPATALVEQPTANYVQQRFTHAVQLVDHIAHTRPLLYAEPRIRVPWAIAASKLSNSEPQALVSGHPDPTLPTPTPDASAFGSRNGADRYLASLAIRYPGDAWQQCGEIEQWLADRTRPAPAKPRMDCRFTAERPQLDGELQEPCWEKTTPLTPSSHSAIRNPQSAIVFAYDEKYFYLAIRCAKQADLAYPVATEKRTYDAELAEHDRVRILIDVDRDYSTWFALTVDHRGFTNDECWGDSSWNPKWFVAAGADPEHWLVEAAIPWAELTATPPTTGAAWAVACERVLPGASPATGATPRDFGVLLFK